MPCRAHRAHKHLLAMQFPIQSAFEKNKLTSHLSHIQMANHLLSVIHKICYNWGGGMDWWPYLENDPPTSNGLFGYPEMYHLDNTALQHNISTNNVIVFYYHTLISTFFIRIKIYYSCCEMLNFNVHIDIRYSYHLFLQNL